MRLIDLDELFPNKVIVVDQSNPMDALNVLINALWNAPEVDAVKAVRCRECNLYKPIKGKRYWGMCRLSGIPMEEHDFCSCGERIEE